MEHGSRARRGQAAPAELGAEARVAPRFTLLLRAAKLISPMGEFLCVIRDVSSTGLSVRNFHALPPGGPVRLQLQSGECHAIEKVWERDGAAGFRFTDEIDIAKFLNEKGRYPKRPVRLKLRFPVMTAHRGQVSVAQILDISQQGARITCRSRLAIDQILRLEAECLPLIQAKVRWRRGDEYGLVFEDIFQFAALAKLAALLQWPQFAKGGNEAVGEANPRAPNHLC